jgi:gluconolactonase
VPFANVALPAVRPVQVVEVDAHEGPVYIPAEDALYFTTVRSPAGVAVKRLQLDGPRFPLGRERVTVVRADGNFANGMTADHEGRLVVCEQGSHSRPARISRLDPVTRATATLVDSWHGLPLNSPNDIVVRSDGTIWFTDPAYGHLQGFRPEPLLGDHVYRFDPASGSLEKVACSFEKPNGLAFSPDELTLYVGDSQAAVIKAFDVVDGRRLAGEHVFAMIADGYPDGLKVDELGRVYTTATGGVQIFNPDGDPAGEIPLPGAVNFAFGGPDRDVLFITADRAIWAAQLDTRGA